MSSTSTIENPILSLDYIKVPFIFIKERLTNFPKKTIKRNQKNCEKAFKRYLKEAETGNSSAQVNLGLCYENGEGKTKNLEKAFELYSKAAEAGNTIAQYDLGWNNKRFLEKAFELYLTAAEAGDPNPQSNLGWCYQKGLGTTINLEKAFEFYSKAAKAGNTSAQYNLGLCYQNESGTTKNLEKAFEFYLKAAEAGDSLAQNNIGWFYQNGLGTTKDQEKAFEHYSKAAEAGNTIAKYNLEVYYYSGNLSLQKIFRTYQRNGWKTMEDLEKLFELYLKTVEEGNITGQYNLGWCYQNGWGTTKNLKKAFELYLKTTEANNSSYQSNFYDLKACELFLDNQSDLEHFEAFFEQLSDEFKCLKCGNFGIIINGFAICPFCDTNEIDKNFESGLPKCLECYRTLKIHFGVNISRGTWDSGNDDINQYIAYTQKISESCRGCLEWISPDEIKFLDKFIAHLKTASCKYILECYGITKDVTTDEFIMVLPFAEHGDLKAFLKMNENTLTWELFLCILFQIACGLRFIHESGLVHGDLHPGNILVLKSNPLKIVIADLGFCRHANSSNPEEIFGVIQYLAPEICNSSGHTTYSNIYSFSIISWEIISGETPWNNIKDLKRLRFEVFKGKRPTINEKHTPQYIKEMIRKNWHQDPYCRDTAKELQQKITAPHDNCNFNELVTRKKGVNYDIISYRSQSISKIQLISNLIYEEEFE
ncbi:hypothetical protein G9A89_004305 [Geosiphon pyriformis]|nr:hypothetical protein G9A89_004305 [Geosiphon pyriformis]